MQDFVNGNSVTASAASSDASAATNPSSAEARMDRITSKPWFDFRKRWWYHQNGNDIDNRLGMRGDAFVCAPNSFVNVAAKKQVANMHTQAHLPVKPG